jgi:hypothetical protein
VALVPVGGGADASHSQPGGGDLAGGCLGLARGCSLVSGGQQDFFGGDVVDEIPVAEAERGRKSAFERRRERGRIRLRRLGESFECGSYGSRCAGRKGASRGAAPPTGPLPSYMAVIVSNSIEQSASTISGNTVHISIVKTNAGYTPDPSHPGTGTVIAQLC